MRRPSTFYQVLYIIANLFTFGAVWFFRAVISHAIYEAHREERESERKARR